MAVIKYRNPPLPPSGQGTFSDNLVGVQLVEGGGLTQGNFEFTQGITEKTNRTFDIGNFSEPISLSTLGIESDFMDREILSKNFRVYPNFDLSKVTNFSSFGSLSKRMSVSVQKIINYFPAALEISPIDFNFNSGVTAYDIIYDDVNLETHIKVPIEKIRNPFDIDFTINSTRNFQLKEMPTSIYRDFAQTFSNYSLFYQNKEFQLVSYTPVSETDDVLEIIVKGRVFSGLSFIYDTFQIRPNTLAANQIFDENFDEIEKFLLNRLSNPIYTANFDYPQESDDGTFYSSNLKLTWPLDGFWNLDIRTPNFDNYVTKLGDVASNMDSFKTNLISRFMTTDAFKEFDTSDQKVEKVLQIYGRSFDEVRKFIDGLAHINSVNYNTGDDIPSALLKNLAQTLGWSINISPISETDFLNSVFKSSNEPNFPGYARTLTPTELNYQYYRNIILNSGYLFRSKGTRRSVEVLLKLIGAPEALVEFNEYIYLADGKIDMSKFGQTFTQISGGTYVKESVVLDPNVTFKISGKTYTGFTTTKVIGDVFSVRDDYPVDDQGFPKPPTETDDYYFQKGAGWFERTPQHRSREIVNPTLSVFTGQNPDVQTELADFTYGEIYFDRFRNFPYMDFGFSIKEIIDNKKSYTNLEVGPRVNRDAGYNSYYYTSNEKFVLNRKNIDLFLSPSLGILYDIWDMSVKYNFPISSQSLIPFGFSDDKGIPFSPVYPKNFSNQKIYLNPNRQTFFEFAQVFWRRMINTRDRLYINDGKTGGYPTLQSVFWKYLESQNIAGLENNQFTYQKMIDYVNGLGDYWIRLVEQMIPATTIWRSGIKYENSILHRQKFVYRREYICIPLPVECPPCVYVDNLFQFDCNKNFGECSLLLTTPLSENLSESFDNLIIANNLNINDCILNSLTSKWYVIVKVGTETLVNKNFFNGAGLSVPGTSYPTQTIFQNSIKNNLNDLYRFGYNYNLENGVIYVSSLGCDDNTKLDKLYIDIAVETKINCK
jgi:hypothetical protein